MVNNSLLFILVQIKSNKIRDMSWFSKGNPSFHPGLNKSHTIGLEKNLYNWPINQFITTTHKKIYTVSVPELVQTTENQSPQGYNHK